MIGKKIKKVNHVGFVERVENNVVYTIEGNSTSNQCLEQEYAINDIVIYGMVLETNNSTFCRVTKHNNSHYTQIRTKEVLI